MRIAKLTRIPIIVLSTIVITSRVNAIHRGENDLPYSQAMTHPLDKKLNDKYNGKCFFMNLGPTGIRARIDPDAPKQFKVMYVFQDAKSPAKGKINIGDVIVGANGKSFREPHGFHRKQAGSRGWQGPPFELALAIEDSQGKKGKLELTVYPGGNRNAVKKVTLQLKPVGRFSKTWPWNCPRSEALLKELVDFMLENNPKQGRLWLQIQHILALWASGDRRALPLVRDMGKRLDKTKIDVMSTGMCTWTWGYIGIFLGEYYNAYKTGSSKSTAAELARGYETSQTFSNGGMSHRPFPAIERRVASGGSKGYGAMAGPGGLSMLAQALFRQNGLPYSEMAYQRTHEAFLMSAGNGNESGAIAYGFKGLKTCRIRLLDPKSPCTNKLGIGFICPTGMKDIGDFQVEEWTQKSSGDWDVKLLPSSKFLWRKNTWDKIKVYRLGENKRIAVYPEPPKEPTSAFRNNHKGGGHNAPVGMGALAHLIGTNDKSWHYLGKHMATCCAYSPQTLWDGHAAAEMHAFFGVLGASWAEEKDFRHFLDYSKTWIILSETHDGGLVEQPFGCQRNGTCSLNGGRNRMSYTHIAVMLLSIPKRTLLITGAKSGKAPARGTASTGGSRYKTPTADVSTTVADAGASWMPKKATRRKRRLVAGRSDDMTKALQQILAALYKRDGLKKTTMTISKLPTKVTLVGMQTRGGALTFQINGSQIKRSYSLSSLSTKDKAAISVAVAETLSSSADAQALAGVFLEIAGYTADADEYYKKAGSVSKKKFDKLFK